MILYLLNIISIKTMETDYVLVTLSTTPFTSEMEKVVGCYKNKELARKVFNFLHENSENKNLEIKFRDYRDKCHIFDDGSIRLQSNGSVIHNKLDRKEYLRLVNFDIPQTDMESYKLYQMKINNKK